MLVAAVALYCSGFMNWEHYLWSQIHKSIATKTYDPELSGKYSGKDRKKCIHLHKSGKIIHTHTLPKPAL